MVSVKWGTPTRESKVLLFSIPFQVTVPGSGIQKPYVGLPTLSDSFLGGSAPNLRSPWKKNPFPTLANLPLSSTDVVELCFWNAPHSGYISPEAIVTTLSMLTRLRSLILEFRSSYLEPTG
jgi:hypothetical protein